MGASIVRFWFNRRCGEDTKSSSRRANLSKFGYPVASKNKHSPPTQFVAFFKSLLEDNLEQRPLQTINQLSSRSRNRVKHIALTLLLSGCATVPYWKHNPEGTRCSRMLIFTSYKCFRLDFFDHCKYPQHADACAVRCVVVNQDHMGTRFAALESLALCDRINLRDGAVGLMRDRMGYRWINTRFVTVKEDHGY